MFKLLHKLSSAFEHTQPHTGMSECFFLDLKVGFYTPHSFQTSCVLSDLPEILRQPNFNCSRTSVSPAQFENKAHKQKYALTLKTVATAANANKSFKLRKSYDYTL